MTTPTWRETTLGEVCDQVGGVIQTGPFGSQLHESDYSTEGIPVVMPKDIIEGKIATDGIARVQSQHVERLSRHKLLNGDIIYGRRGDIGRQALIRKEQQGWMCGTGCLRLSFGESVLNPLFLHYYLRQSDVISWIANQAVGATMPNLNTTILRSVPVRVPSLPFQRRIAGILSAYDDLIENSQRRIRILESMARALFREWFVHFRFPGHEKIRKVASSLGEMPEGWEVKELQEVAYVIDCLHSKKPPECAGGPGVFLQLNNVGEFGKLDMQQVFRLSTEDYSVWTSRIELQPGDCVVTNVGRVGAVAQIPEGVKAAPGRNMTAVRPRAGMLTPTYLIEYLLSAHMTSEVAKKKDQGTIMDSLNVKGIIRLHVPCPPMEAMERFERIARPMRKDIELLTDQIQILRRTRDLLLPRLLSGQTNVEAPNLREN